MLPSQTIKKFLVYVVIPCAVGLIFISKVFYAQGCYAFEANDEAAHTFVEINVAWRMLRAGQLPLMNLYNNFGTPLLGDPVVLPFAPHSLSYLLFPPYLAATINRWAFLALTVALLTYFYHQRFGLSRGVASVCAGVAVMLPSYNYFSVHHPHQGVLAYFVAILILQHRFRTSPTIKNLFLVYLALLVFTFGVGLNAFLFGIPFLILSQLFESRFRLDKPFLLFVLLLSAAFLPIYPHLAYFFQLTPLTARASLNLTALLPFTPQRLLLDVIAFANRPELLHASVTVYYSLPVLVLAGWGLFKTQNKRDLPLVLALGCLPIVFVLSVLAFGRLRDYLPVLKAVDVGRLLWFANIYFLVAVGYALEILRKSAITLRYAGLAVLTAVGGVAVMGAYIFNRYFVPQAIVPALLLLFIPLLLVAVGVSFALRLPGLRNTFGIVALALPMSFLPVLDYNIELVRDLWLVNQGKALGCHTLFFNTPQAASFHPARFTHSMTPFSRLTAQFDPIFQGALQSAAKFNIFGSDGRSIILSRDFREYLLDKDLVQLGWYDFTYYFTSTDLNELSRLGIKYVITRQLDEFREVGWILTDTDATEKLNLFENPNEVSLAYLDEGATVQYLPTSQIAYRGNEVAINLQSVAPAKETDLVLTFVNWPGWKVSVDGQAARLESAPDQFLRVRVGSAAQQVKFTFEPVTVSQLVIYPILSILLFGLAILLLKFSSAGFTGRSN